MKKIMIDYSNSGINTLRVTAWLFLIAGIIASFVFVLNDPEKGISYVTAISSILSGLFIFSLSMTIATIAENSLYQKAKLINELHENEFEIDIL